MDTFKNAKTKAREIFKEYHFEEPPINVFSIARSQKIKVRYFKPDHNTDEILAGFDKSAKVIYLNANLSASRQAFIIAHELGHYFLSHTADHYTVVERGSEFWDNLTDKEKNSQDELEANVFAIELLMPENLFRKVKQRYDLTDNDVNPLKRLFGIPYPVLEARLRV